MHSRAQSDVKRKIYVHMYESLPLATRERRTVDEVMFDPKAGGVPGRVPIDRISSLKDK